MILKFKKQTIYYFIFFILFFISYNVTIYGYFVSKYILAAFAFIALLILLFLNLKSTKLSKKNVLYSICFIIICLLYINRNKQIETNLFSDCWTFVGLITLFFLQFNDDWVKVPCKIINFFTFEHVIGTYFCYFFPSLYRNLILPVFSNNIGYSDLINQVNHNMIAGFATNYGSNATYLTIGFLVLFGMYIQKDKKQAKDKLTIAIVYLAMIITGKRGTLIFGTLSAIAIYFIANKEKISKKVFKGLSLCFILIVLLIFLSSVIPNISMVYNRIFNSNDILNGRENLYGLAWTIFKENPILGIGWGNFKYYYSNFYNTAEQLNAHNIYLQLLCELGIIGAGIIIGFMIYTVYKTFIMLKSKKYLNYKLELTVSLVIQIMVMLVGISSTPLYGIEALYPYLVMCAIPYAISINERRLNDEC